MHSAAKTVEEYLDSLPPERQAPMRKLRDIIRQNMPEGFVETMGHGMMGYVVPFSLYPAGYHVDPKQPLPFFGIASQKNFIGVYHMGMYRDPALYNWFVEKYPQYSHSKLDMGKSCIRLKKMTDIPYELIGELASKTTVDAWVKLYEKSRMLK